MLDELPFRFRWPRISPDIEQAVVRQLYDSVSIYGNDGVFSSFEESFASAHGRKLACLFNSGTSALHAAYTALDLGPGDEVICPAYTFFATAMPILWTGATPVLCESNSEGNIDVAAVESLIGSRTRAVVVTHLWGIPADAERLRAICDRYGLALVEDCSHAHGSRIADRLVGTFGDIAIWSLQGSKTITAGEGGILLCDKPDFLYKALLLGHYNKRCRQQIPSGDPHSELALTGYGLKLRAHPLGIAIAAQILSELPELLAGRAEIASMWTTTLSTSDRVEVVQLEDRTSSWYAFPILMNDPSDRDLALRQLLNLGLLDADAPGSTQPLNLLPAFQKPSSVPNALREVVSRLSYQPGMFPVAESVWARTIKLPVFVGDTDDERRSAEVYQSGLEKVFCGDH